MNEKTIFFDIGGTLVSCPDIFEVYTLKLGIRQPSRDVYEQISEAYQKRVFNVKNGEIPFDTIAGLQAVVLREIAGRYGCHDIADQVPDITINVYGNQSCFFPETQKVLEYLRSKNIKMIIASDNDRAILEAQKTKHNLDLYFTDAVISEDRQAYKATDGFLEGLTQYMPNNPENCWFVGDMPFDIECGNRLGIRSVHIARNNPGNPDADYVINNLNELITIMETS